MTIIKPEDIANQHSFDLARNTLINFTPPLFTQHGAQLTHVGTGFFCRFHAQHFLVTAGHLYKQFNENLGVIFKNTHLTLSGTTLLTGKGYIKEDYIDLACYELNEVFLGQMNGNYDFYDLARLNIDNEDDLSGLNYLLVGHPLTRTKIKPKKRKIELAPFVLRSDLSKKGFDGTQIQKPTHISINYRKRRILDFLNNRTSQGPDPNGLSGSAVWKLTNLITHDLKDVGYEPAGILIEYDSNLSVLLFTRMRVLTEAMRLHFGLTLPASKKLKIKAQTAGSTS